MGLEPRGTRSKAKAAKHRETQKRKTTERAERMKSEKDGMVGEGLWEMNTGDGVDVTGGGEEWEGLSEGEVGGRVHPEPMSPGGEVAVTGGGEGWSEGEAGGRMRPEPMSPGVWAGAEKEDNDDDEM